MATSSKKTTDTISIKELKELLLDNLNALWENDPSLRTRYSGASAMIPPIMVWGAPGVGKSTAVRELTQELGIGFIDVRLAQREPVDMRGLPVPDEKDNSVKWLVSGEWPRDLNSRGIIIKSSAGDNLYPRASLDNLVDVVGGTTAVQVPTLDSSGHIESRFLPETMSLLDSDGRIDSRYLPPDFFPPAARVTVSGTVYVSSGALLRDVEETSGFIRVLSGGTAKRITVTSGNFTVSSGGAATDMTWNSPGIMYIPGGHVQYVDCRKGSIEVQKGGHLEHVTANTGCLLFVSSGGTATDIVEYGGYIRVPTGAVGQFVSTVIPNLALSASQSATVHSGNQVSNAAISSGGSLHVFEGGTLTGQCSVLNGGSMVLYNGAVLDFRISDMSPGDTARINDTTKISRSNNAVVTYTLTVAENQPSGMYALGGNCSSWNTELQVRTDDGVSLGLLALNGSLTAYGAVFTLSIIDNVLSVTVNRS